MVILKLAGKRLIQNRNKLSKDVELYEITVNCKLVGSRSSQIITGSIYKPLEVVKLQHIGGGRRVTQQQLGYHSKPRLVPHIPMV